MTRPLFKAIVAKTQLSSLPLALLALFATGLPAMAQEQLEPPPVASFTPYQRDSANLSIDSAVSLNIPVANISNKQARRILVDQTMYTKSAVGPDGKERLWGFGVRWIVNVKKSKTELEIPSTVVGVAAAAQLGLVEAEARFQIIGMSSKELSALQPVPAELTIETYGKMNQSYNKILELMATKSGTIVPQLIGDITIFTDKNQVRQNELYKEQVARWWAISRAADGVDEAKALEEYTSGSAVPVAERERNAIRDIYSYLSALGDKKRQQDEAKRLRQDLRLRK